MEIKSHNHKYFNTHFAPAQEVAFSLMLKTIPWNEIEPCASPQKLQ